MPSPFFSFPSSDLKRGVYCVIFNGTNVVNSLSTLHCDVFRIDLEALQGLKVRGELLTPVRKTTTAQSHVPKTTTDSKTGLYRGDLVTLAELPKLHPSHYMPNLCLFFLPLYCLLPRKTTFLLFYSDLAHFISLKKLYSFGPSPTSNANYL
ncbi:hypothetical protein AVEN_242883-1 [Araneus ventricosus]|uniref:Uncharacterized protein n=1 Tax=Araneus ventricosus TaxID=182803 RepID=A0A4Y2U6L9_ARAVE|nr:hypothetical protein AVEN_242883-1 [Araneus ventricosus]